METKILIIYSPCIENPWLIYRGYPKENELYLRTKFLELKTKYDGKNVMFLSYPCPETCLLGVPRIPCSKEMYERVGMGDLASKILMLIDKIIKDVKPKRIIFVGIKGSPTCGIYHTYSLINRKKLDEFVEYIKEKRFDKSMEIKENMKIIKGSGVLFEVIRGKYKDAIYLEVYKKTKEDIDKSLKELKKKILGDENPPLQRSEEVARV